LPVLCRRRLPETAERDPIGALAAASIEACSLAGRPSTLGGDVNDRDRVDVHKHELTAVAVDELGRELARWSGPPEAALLGWARSLAGKRLWALEDCRHVSRGLEALLLGAGERLVRVPPRLTARPSVGAGACAAIRMRSTRSPSPAPPCASRASIGPGPESRACGS